MTKLFLRILSTAGFAQHPCGRELRLTVAAPLIDGAERSIIGGKGI